MQTQLKEAFMENLKSQSWIVRYKAIYFLDQFLQLNGDRGSGFNEQVLQMFNRIEDGELETTGLLL